MRLTYSWRFRSFVFIIIGFLFFFFLSLPISSIKYNKSCRIFYVYLLLLWMHLMRIVILRFFFVVLLNNFCALYSSYFPYRCCRLEVSPRLDPSLSHSLDFSPVHKTHVHSPTFCVCSPFSCSDFPISHRLLQSH